MGLSSFNKKMMQQLEHWPDGMVPKKPIDVVTLDGKTLHIQGPGDGTEGRPRPVVNGGKSTSYRNKNAVYMKHKERGSAIAAINAQVAARKAQGKKKV